MIAALLAVAGGVVEAGRPVGHARERRPPTGLLNNPFTIHQSQSLLFIAVVDGRKELPHEHIHPAPPVGGGLSRCVLVTEALPVFPTCSRAGSPDGRNHRGSLRPVPAVRLVPGEDGEDWNWDGMTAVVPLQWPSAARLDDDEESCVWLRAWAEYVWRLLIDMDPVTQAPSGVRVSRKVPRAVLADLAERAEWEDGPDGQPVKLRARCRIIEHWDTDDRGGWQAIRYVVEATCARGGQTAIDLREDPE
jgi:hypothetical protein